MLKVLSDAMALRTEVIEWLLEPAQPAVRYRTLTDLLDRSPNDPEVREAAASLTQRGWVRDILRVQHPGGYWESRGDLYRPKYTATIWRFIVLTDLGLTAKDLRIRRTCELFLSEYAQADGGLDTPGADRSELCLTGNLARSLLKAGYGDDRRVRAAFEWIVKNQREDGGWHCFVENTFGRGTLDAWEGLDAIASLPRSRWTRSIQRAADAGAEFYLERELFHQGKRYVPWLRFHYPVHYYYDVLVGLDMVTALGHGGDRRLRPALDLLRSKQRRNGTWLLDKVHPDLGGGAGYRFRRPPKRFALEAEGTPSKWVTLRALHVLKRVEESGTG